MSSLIDTVYALLTREGWKVINNKILEFLDILAFTKISLFLLDMSWGLDKKAYKVTRFDLISWLFFFA